MGWVSTKPVYRIVYTSQTLVWPGGGIYRQISRKARVKNQRLGITGCLLKHGDRLVQFLEGPENAVKTLYSQIYRDSRHQAPFVLSEGRRSGRDFPGQSMNYDNITQVNSAKYDFVLGALDQWKKTDQQSQRAAEMLLGCFVRKELSGSLA